MLEAEAILGGIGALGGRHDAECTAMVLDGGLDGGILTIPALLVNGCRVLYWQKHLHLPVSMEGVDCLSGDDVDSHGNDGCGEHTDGELKTKAEGHDEVSRQLHVGCYRSC